MIKKIFLIKIFSVLIITIGFFGCGSVPPEILISHELIGEGLQTLKKNQIKIIESYAADQKENLKLNLQYTIDDVLKEQLRGRESLPLDEVKILMIEYANDLLEETHSIENKKKQLVNETNQLFDEIESLHELNTEYMKSLIKLRELQKKMISEYGESIKNFKDKLNK